MVSQGITMTFPLYDGQQQGNTSSEWESHGCVAGGTPGGGKWPCRTKFEGHPLRSVQD
jgi:hypothetical protein